MLGHVLLGLAAASASAQSPIFSLEAAGRNGQDFRDILCTADDVCPGNGTCAGKQCVLAEDCPGSSCTGGTCTATYCTTATRLLADEGDIAAGDEIKVEVFLRQWDDDPLSGVCQNGDACTIPENGCLGHHCDRRPDIACSTHAECTPYFARCIANYCIPAPRVDTVQFKLDMSSFVSNQGAGAGVFDYAEIPCDPASCTFMEGAANSCSCFHGHRFSAFCTCYLPQVCDSVSSLCTHEGVGYFEKARPDFLFFRSYSITEIAPIVSGWEFVGITMGKAIPDTNDHEKRYVATVHLQLASPGHAAGSFEIGLSLNPDTTFVLSEALVPMMPLIEPLFIDLGQGPCDPNPCPDLGVECTVNQCVPLSPTTFTCEPIHTKDPCTDDGNLCTLDVCDGGVCTHPWVRCPRGMLCNPVDGVCRVPPVEDAGSAEPIGR